MSRRPLTRRCRRCGKWLFRSYARAVRVLHRLSEPGRVYWSPACGGWHITSLTPEEMERRRVNRLQQTNEDGIS